MSEVIPISKKYETVQAMLAGMMVNNKCKRGFVICFDDEGTMSVGHVESTRGDVCMAAMYLTDMACRAMRTP